MKWEDVKPIHNQKRRSLFKSRNEVYDVNTFVTRAMKQIFISSVDWEFIERKISGKTLTSKQICEVIYGRGGKIPKRFLEQLLRYEGLRCRKEKKKFKEEKIIFRAPDDCDLNKIKDLQIINPKKYIKGRK